MPVLVLLLSLIGNYFVFRGLGDTLFVEEPIYATDFEIESTVVPNNIYVDDIYINRHLTVEETVSILSTIDFDIYNENGMGESSYIFLSTDDVVIYIMNLGPMYGITLNGTPIFSSIAIPEMGINFVGWNNTSDGLIYAFYLFHINGDLKPFTSLASTYLVGTQNSKLIDLFSITPFVYISPGDIIGETTKLISLFDYSLINTDNTFKKFQLPFLRNVFESVFNILEFENSYVSSFVLTSFTWMIQLLLLHVVVDSLAFIFKMYHKLMDKVV